MSKSRQQGTTEERRQRLTLEAFGFDVTRLAEEGLNDKGDLLLRLTDIDIYIESKDRSVLNVHETLQKANLKAPGHAVVWWKRKKLKEGNARRTQVGEPVIAISEGLFIEMLQMIEFQHQGERQ